LANFLQGNECKEFLEIDFGDQVIAKQLRDTLKGHNDSQLPSDYNK
jgi:hypothetical protein